MNSSPLPSPSALQPLRPNQIPGSRKAPIPVDAPTGFLSARQFVSQDELQQEHSLASRRLSRTPSLGDAMDQDATKAVKSAPTGKLKRPTKKAVAVEKVANAAAGAGKPELAPVPAKRGRKKKAETPVDEGEIAMAEIPGGPTSAPKRPRKTTKVAHPVVESDGTEAQIREEQPKRVLKPQTRKPKQVVERTAAPPPAAESGNPSASLSVEASVPKPKLPRARKAKVNVQIEDATAITEETVAVVVETPSLEAGLPRAYEADETPNTKSAENAPKIDTISYPELAGYNHAKEKNVEVPSTVVAPRRRKNWTPPPGPHSALPPSFQDQSFQATAATGQHTVDGTEDSGEPSKFSNLLDSFVYEENEAMLVSKERTNGEPATKRRKVDHAEEKSKPAPRKKREPKAKAEPKKKKEPKPKPPPKPKKPKAPPKQPHSLTNLALAAYRVPLVQAEDGAAKVTSYFTTQDAAAPEAGPAGPSRAGKEKGGTEMDARFKLLSPQAAHRSFKNQEWLFGSSSQLAAAESPDEFRDLQRAIKASEELISSQNLERSSQIAAEADCPVSFIRVPSAPHGTDLSIGQASKSLWTSAARDHDQGIFDSNQGLGSIMEEDDPLYDGNSLPEAWPERDAAPMRETFPNQEAEEPQDSAFVDIDTIPMTEGKDSEKFINIFSSSPAASRDNAISLSPSRKAALSTEENLAETMPAVSSQRHALQRLDPNASLLQPVDDTTSKLASDDLAAAKEPVDTTAADVSPAKRSRGRPRKVVTDLNPQPPTPKAPVGRPRKIVTDAISSQPPTPKHLLRPPKALQRAQSPQQPVSASTTTPAAPKPRGKRASERKEEIMTSSPYLDIDDISDPECAISPPSPPKRLQQTTESETSPPLVAVDTAPSVAAAQATTLEMSVPSVLPPPPSPPGPKKPNSTARAKRSKARTRARAIAAAIANGAPPPRITEKQLLSLWSTIHPVLFPQISTAVKAQQEQEQEQEREREREQEQEQEQPEQEQPGMPSTKTKAKTKKTKRAKKATPKTTSPNPTWWQKILLYDPIVIEDLCAWLNSQGLVIDVSAAPSLFIVEPIYAARGRGGGGGSAAAAQSAENAILDLLPKFDAEPIRPWMVQKWCEENSVCCLWKDGLRGGVRLRY